MSIRAASVPMTWTPSRLAETKMAGRESGSGLAFPRAARRRTRVCVSGRCPDRDELSQLRVLESPGFQKRRDLGRRVVPSEGDSRGIRAKEDGGDGQT